MGTLWKWVNRNSGGIVVLVMVLSSIAGITTFIWTEINSVNAEVQVARTEIKGLRDSNELILENIRLLQEDNRLLWEEMRLLRQEMREDLEGLETRLRSDMDRNQQELTQALIGHIHDDDGSAIFKAPVDASQ